MFVFIHPTYFYFSWDIVFKITFFWNRIRGLLSKRVLKRRISSHTWDCDVLGCNKPCSKSLTSRAWSSRTNMNLKPQTWRQDPGHVTFNAKRQTWIYTAWPSFPLIFPFTLSCFYIKISSFMSVLTIEIVQDCFYPLICYSEKFSTWVWRLPFAVNVNLNLSNAEKPQS